MYECKEITINISVLSHRVLVLVEKTESQCIQISEVRSIKFENIGLFSKENNYSWNKSGNKFLNIDLNINRLYLAQETSKYHCNIL